MPHDITTKYFYVNIKTSHVYEVVLLMVLKWRGDKKKYLEINIRIFQEGLDIAFQRMNLGS